MMVASIDLDVGAVPVEFGGAVAGIDPGRAGETDAVPNQRPLKESF